MSEKIEEKLLLKCRKLFRSVESSAAYILFFSALNHDSLRPLGNWNLFLMLIFMIVDEQDKKLAGYPAVVWGLMPDI